MKLETKIITFVIGLALFTYVVSPGIGLLRADGSLWSRRNEIVNLSGVIAFYLMTTVVLLSMRMTWIDRQIGLDRAYGLHKSVGIAATIAAAFHWLLEKVPHWLIQLGIIAHPGDLSSGDYSKLEIILFTSGTAIIEYVFYVAVALIIIALFQRIPYRFFWKTHKALPALFIIIAYHAATAQLRDRWLTTPAGYLILAVAFVGIVCACLALCQRIGASRRIKGTVSEVKLHGSLIDIAVQLKSPFSYRPGQFVFLRFAHDNEPHPITISGGDIHSNSLRFTIKALGDFTNALAQNLRAGHQIDIEGPYGAFNFSCDAQRQIWIAGGIGITPFMAQLNFLAANKPTDQPIDLWYCTKTEEEGEFPEELEQLCLQNGVTLHRMVAERGELLSAAHLKEEAGDFKNAAIWFCGPHGFANHLISGLKPLGFDVEHNFHREEFRFR